MEEIYGLSREGGPRSPRFTAYLTHVEHGWGLSSYNPMAGPAALDTVRQLKALDAERLALDAAHDLAARCEFEGELTLAIVVASAGMWTDRIATEVRHRTCADRRGGHGEVLIWSREAVDAALVQRESAAEVVRTMWTARFGAPRTLGAVLAREGLAGALSSSILGPSMPAEVTAVDDAIAVLGDTTVLGEIVGILYGDQVATALGWTPLGLAEHAGLRWAVARAMAIVGRDGPGAALHDTGTLIAS